MPNALIGSTGFVGGNLARQMRFDDLFHSRNIADIRGREYETVVCAGVRAEKWKANADPAADRAGIQTLLDHLAHVTAKKFVLISTVDVYPIPTGVDEGTLIDASAASAYGRNRYELEQEIAGRFDTTVIRLPGLFGVGLKKNVIFDLLNDNLVDRINPAGVFQYYNLAHLADDVRTAVRHHLEVVNFATEPIETAELAREVFDRELPPLPGLVARYDFRSQYADLFHGSDGYLYGRDQVLSEMKAFAAEYPARRATA
jgi:nucleoside-diphosphate-sugar epimerase